MPAGSPRTATSEPSGTPAAASTTRTPTTASARRRSRLGSMSGLDVSFASLDADGEERFISLRRKLGVGSFGMNLIALEPGQRGRIHAHERQEEVYIVLEGELTLALGDGESGSEAQRR